MSDKFTIAQVAPYPWEEQRETKLFIERLVEGFKRRGHRVVILAPSESRSLVRDSRRLAREAEHNPDLLFDESRLPFLAVGHSLSLKQARRGGMLTLPIDVARTVERVLTKAPFDFVHVHEPFAPSTASTALRHSRSLNIGTFHRPSERVLSTQVARRLVELFFGRLDARCANHEVTRDLIASFFPGEYTTIRPGADLAGKERPEGTGAPMRILFCAEEERRALRLFLRALRKLPRQLDWTAVIWSRHAEDYNLRLSRALRERVSLRGPADSEIDEELLDTDIFCCCSYGSSPTPLLLQEALASGALCISSRLPLYEELLQDGDLGLLYEPGDVMTLVGQIKRLLEDTDISKRLRMRSLSLNNELTWESTVDRYQDLYRSVASRRHDQSGNATIGKRIGKRKLIHCDLHMHTDHSPDCATPVEVLLDTAKARGLDAIAITDHNEISGAVEARKRAEGIKVIVAEEVKTADQGEVIGLFIERKIPRGMTLAETIAAIRKQGGLVYVPHPFDRFHSVPDYDNLLKVVEDIDIIEVFNPRIAFSAFNEEAERFAAKYRIVPAAGSDSHVAQGLGSVKIRMRDFEGPKEFLESLRDADIVRRHKNLLYVQTLKFLQTTGRPGSARRAAKARRTKH